MWLSRNFTENRLSATCSRLVSLVTGNGAQLSGLTVFAQCVAVAEERRIRNAPVREWMVHGIADDFRVLECSGWTPTAYQVPRAPTTS